MPKEKEYLLPGFLGYMVISQFYSAACLPVLPLVLLLIPSVVWSLFQLHGNTILVSHLYGHFISIYY